jgi:transcriptional regulator with XRE-family HTH domain
MAKALDPRIPAVGQRMKEIREQAGVSMEAVARALGLKYASSIANIEAGVQDIPLSRLLRFADFFRIPVVELLPAHEAGRMPPEEARRRLVKILSKAPDEVADVLVRCIDALRHWEADGGR